MRYFTSQQVVDTHSGLQAFSPRRERGCLRAPSFRSSFRGLLGRCPGGQQRWDSPVLRCVLCRGAGMRARGSGGAGTSRSPPGRSGAARRRRQPPPPGLWRHLPDRRGVHGAGWGGERGGWCLSLTATCGRGRGHGGGRGRGLPASGALPDSERQSVPGAAVAGPRRSPVLSLGHVRSRPCSPHIRAWKQLPEAETGALRGIAPQGLMVDPSANPCVPGKATVSATRSRLGTPVSCSRCAAMLRKAAGSFPALPCSR